MKRREVFVIAEFGSSPEAHGWQLGPWCWMAAKAGADAAKVQLWRAEHFPEAERAAKRLLEFPRRKLEEFVEVAHTLSLRAGASVFDFHAACLVHARCDFMKLAAREQYNRELIDIALDSPLTVYRSISDMDAYRAGPRIVTLFTVQRYPLPMLPALAALLYAALWFRALGVRRWGWSSHTSGALDCVLAARLGAQVVEKHLALLPSDVEAGHSLLPDRFGDMVRRIRSV